MSLKRAIAERASALALRVPPIRRSVQRATALALKVPAIRQSALRELVPSLRVVCDLGAKCHDYPSRAQWATANSPLLRELLDEVDEELLCVAREEIKNGFRLLRPYSVKGFQKARFGSANDGGYVMLDDFRGIDTVLSFGIGMNADWDLDVAKRGVTVYQFDHTVDSPPIQNPRFVFAKKRISTEAGVDTESLSSLVERHDRQNIHPNLLLKLDIECDEWLILEKAPPEILRRFSQIVGEFHFLEGLSADVRWRRLITRVLKKVTDDYAVIHLHASNWGDFHAVGDLIFPNTFEITFANRSVYSVSETNETFPGPMDAPNLPDRPDVDLGTFRF